MDLGAPPPELDVHVYDVGHGDHILLRVREGERRFHAVIDCHWLDATSDPPALAQLKAWGVETLDLLALTHPHQDHFMGLASIARYFGAEGRRLVRFVDFGLDLRQVADACYGVGVRARNELYALHAATHAAAARPRCEPLRDALPARPITEGVALGALAPVPGSWTEEHRRLLAGERLRPNRVSSVLLVQSATWRLLLCGDLEAEDWAQALGRARGLGLRLESDVVKAGHHGAPNGNPPELWDALTVAGRVPHAAISTRGTKQHPTESSLHTLIDRGALPRCTRYGPVCAPHVPRARQRRALALALADSAADPLAEAKRSARLRPREDRRCFGTLRFTLSAAGVALEPEVAGARCHLRAAWHGQPA